MTMFHPRWREFALSHLDETFDLIVIGGGITGCRKDEWEMVCEIV